MAYTNESVIIFAYRYRIELCWYRKDFAYYMGVNGYLSDMWVDCGEDEEKFLTLAKEAIDNLI